MAAGSSKELARRVGVSPQAVSQWDTVPPLRVLKVEKSTGIPRWVLRPDLYPPSLENPGQARST
ncbi:transcriptional regulator [Agrobacterium pusense]|uniref:transcriptional regulator n=1 Tax=Agrobacterium pusense TaxID=648995 RepID=UPI0028A6FF7F|nr:Cro/CI family transcriptional regulator [Agrobacterium pusense]